MNEMFVTESPNSIECLWNLKLNALKLDVRVTHTVEMLKYH